MRKPGSSARGVVRLATNTAQTNHPSISL
jgi:hypothetical protein